jgi:hypothetical protein
MQFSFHVSQEEGMLLCPRKKRWKHRTSLLAQFDHAPASSSPNFFQQLRMLVEQLEQ